MKDYLFSFRGHIAERKEIVRGYISTSRQSVTAIQIGKGCPIFNYNGNVEIREIAKT
ncbi:MAG TPA: hypothetical protein VGQ09_18095 [Chitinophagaceae bacterium]|nr:hypothetical protein [Chitinophagaceae bacterium]